MENIGKEGGFEVILMRQTEAGSEEEDRGVMEKYKSW